MRTYVGSKVLDFGRKKWISSEFRPFRSGPVDMYPGQIISALFEFLARPSYSAQPV